MKTIHDSRYKELIARMIEKRDELRITQVALADQLGRPQSYVAKVENFERRIDLVEFRDWMRAMGVSPHELLQQLQWWTDL